MTDGKWVYDDKAGKWVYKDTQQVDLPYGAGDANVTTDGDRVTVNADTNYAPPGVNHMTYQSDNVNDIREKHGNSDSLAPSSLNKAGKDKVEVDVESLGDAKTWLTGQADYMAKLYHALDDIHDLIKGQNNMSSLGTFPHAQDLYKKHESLYQSAHTALKSITESIYDSADAVGKVASGYSSAEDRNAMNSADMEKIFTNQGADSHQF